MIIQDLDQLSFGDQARTLVQPRGKTHTRAKSTEGLDIANIIDQAQAFRLRQKSKTASLRTRARMQRAASILDSNCDGKHNLPRSTCGFVRRAEYRDSEEGARCSAVCIASSQHANPDVSSAEADSNRECESECTTLSL